MSTKRRKTRRPAAPVRKTNRRWRVPPPLTHGPEPLEGGTILEELPTPLGGLLWETARDVRLWTAAPREERSELFSAESAAKRERALGVVDAPDPLRSALSALSTVLSEPADAEVDALAEACRSVAGWAEEAGLLGIALAYTQSLALLHETDPRVAYEVGVLARRRAEHARAETWFRRAVMLARQVGDWTSYSLAFVGLGNLYLQRGNYPIARKLHIRAKRAAHRHSLHAIEGMALHDLFVMASASGEVESAEELATDALAAYGPGHPRLPVLAHDVAYHWLERGYFGPALSVFAAVLPHIERPAERIGVLADTARAAAAIGASQIFDDAVREVLSLAERPDTSETAAQAMLDIAHGAATLKDWPRAESAARRAIEIATARNEARTRLAAESVLESVQRGRGVRPAPEPVSETAGASALASRFVERLG